MDGEKREVPGIATLMEGWVKTVVGMLAVVGAVAKTLVKESDEEVGVGEESTVVRAVGKTLVKERAEEVGVEVDGEEATVASATAKTLVD